MKMKKQFRLEEETVDKLNKLVKFNQELMNDRVQNTDELIPKKAVTMTDVIEYLISKEYGRFVGE
jgi:hypothetical protein